MTLIQEQADSWWRGSDTSEYTHNQYLSIQSWKLSNTYKGTSTLPMLQGKKEVLMHLSIIQGKKEVLMDLTIIQEENTCIQRLMDADTLCLNYKPSKPNYKPDEMHLMITMHQVTHLIQQ